jgi:hypothetical protein
MAGLTYKQKKAITALLSEPTQEEAAKVAGVGYRTLCRWLAEDEKFQQALTAAEAEAVANAARLMAGGAIEAVNTLLSILKDKEASHKERIAAARAFLSSLPTMRLLGSIESRLAEVESGKNDNPAPNP